MKSDAGTGLEDGLRARFAAELGRAERDYPALRPRLAGETRTRRRRILSPAGLGGAILTLASVAVLTVVLGPWRGGAVPAAPPSTATPGPNGVVTGSDGVPTSIAGERVYRGADSTAYSRLTTSFLLGGPLVARPQRCPAGTVRQGAEALLLSSPCYVFSIDGVTLAPKDLVVPPEGIVVVRVHAHDLLAAACDVEMRARCEAALVVEREVWPVESMAFGSNGLPMTVDGARVYRADELAAAAEAAHGVLVVGRVVRWVPSCPAEVGSGQTQAEGDLLGSCGSVGLAGSGSTMVVRFAPRGAGALFDLPAGTAVVVLVHTADSEAAGCPAATRPRCAAAVVVDRVVWWSTAAGSGAAATP